MTLSKETIDLLTIFAAIQSNLYVDPEHHLSTCATSNAVVAKADLPAEFDAAFGVYDLSQFLSFVKMCSNPEIEISKTSIKIASGNGRFDYRPASPDVLKYLPDGKLPNMPEPTAVIEVDGAQVSQLLKAAGVCKAPVIRIVSGEDGVTAVALNPGDSSANTFTLDLSSEPAAEGTFNLAASNLALLPTDRNYKLSLTKGISHWVSAQDSLEVYIAVERDA